MSRLLDGALRADLRPRPRNSVDVSDAVLRRLGFQPSGRLSDPSIRRVVRLRRLGTRFALVMLLAAAAMTGVLLHNRAPDAVEIDGSLPRAVDRAIHSIMPISGSGQAEPAREASEDALERFLERLDRRGSSSGSPPHGAFEHRDDGGGDGNGEGAEEGSEERAAAPYRWVHRPTDPECLA